MGKTRERGRESVARWMLCVVAIIGCTDKAEVPYKTCLEKVSNNQFSWALMYCNEAARVDPTSASGKAAAKLIPELEVKKKQELVQRAEWEKEAEEKAVKARLERAAFLRETRRVRAEYWGHDRDTECVNAYRWDDLPFRVSYRGGTDQDNADVAFSDGCRPFRLVHGSGRDIPGQFCCPR